MLFDATAPRSDKCHLFNFIITRETGVLLKRLKIPVIIFIIGVTITRLSVDQVHVSCSTPAGRNQGKCAQNMAHDLGSSSAVSNLDINLGFTLTLSSQAIDSIEITIAV